MGLKLKLVIVFVIALSASLVLIALSPMVSSWIDSLTQDTFRSGGSLYLEVSFSQNKATSAFDFNVTRGSSTQINVTFASLSKTQEFIVPLYLSIGAFENQQFSKVITSAPEPYPSLPPYSHDDSELDKPFEANFSINPLTIKPGENQTVVLTITALEDAPLGMYTMLLSTGNSDQTGLGGANLQLSVN